MSALIRSFVSLFLMSTAVGFAADASVSVYLRDTASQPRSVLESMKAETESVLAPTGHAVVWWSPGDIASGVIVVMDLRGTCEPTSAQAPLTTSTALGSTLVVNGEVTPFGQVNCDIVARYLGRGLSGVPAALRSQQLGRALGRVLAHEIYHVVGETRVHARDGVAKPEFTAAELLSSSFGFEGTPTVAWRAAKSVAGDAPETHDK